ncbi:M20 family metallopeptidase [Sphingomonas canadensis]|uniref:M20 family metallopeptidase n=1 Tax=Sphingomonas canadensis TaxID=1219257 RepID=A0ABW3H1Q5_9SPHN|nr:M20 family metallopeptidase [Sphingomonas canadensis]MCW3834695.1 M20 family metallopeptidase [Sphingomonas canadensis]
MDASRLKAFVGTLWDDEVIPELVEYIRIPNKSPMFDPQWAANGHMERAVVQFEAWARAKAAQLPGATVEVVRLEGRTPLLLIEVPGAIDDTVLLYGHLDKQPEMTGWAEGTGPWVPVIRDGKLYGRGGADDGYAMYGALTALLALADQGIPHARCVLVIEACEESGSPDLPFYIDHLADRIGTPSLVVCLDSGCGNYDQLWLTTSLRGMASGTLSVDVLEEGVHSGDASGVVPSSFRILRSLIGRVEDPDSGDITLDALHAQIPPERIEQARSAAAALGDSLWERFPFVEGMGPVSKDGLELVLNRTWRPTLSVTGLAGAPLPENAGNVLRPGTAAKLSFRFPPTLDAVRADALVKEVLEADPPYGARVHYESDGSGNGWNAPALAPWLAKAADTASDLAFGKPAAMLGEGGSIPFMGMLGEKFPQAQFVITGVLGPQSNAHGPNEFLHIQMGKNVTVAVASILADHLRARA